MDCAEAMVMSARQLFITYITISLFLTGITGFSAFSAPGVPVINGRAQGDYARITFSWPTNTHFKVSQQGQRLIISFDDVINSSPAALTSSLGAYVTAASIGADKRSVVLSLAGEYPVRSFISGTTIGVDLLKVTSTPKKAPLPVEEPVAEAPKPVEPKPEPQKVEAEKKAEPAKKVEEAKVEPAKPEVKPEPAKPEAKAEPVKLEAKPVEAPKPEPVATAVPEPTSITPKPAPAAAVVSPSPQASLLMGAQGDLLQSSKAQEALGTPAAEKPKLLSPAAEPSPEPQIQRVEPFATPVAVTDPPAPPVEAEPAKTATKAEVEPVTETAAKPVEAPEPAAPEPAETVTTPSGNVPPMLVSIEKTRNDTRLHFPWKERVAAAAFTRGSQAWIIFNKPAAIRENFLKPLLPPFIADFSTQVIGDHTVIRMTSTMPLYMSADKEKDSYSWKIGMSRHPQTPKHPVVPEVMTAAPLKPNVFLPALENSDIFKITDPVLGSELTVIPNFGPSSGVFPERRFVDFILARTAQGIVIESFNDKLRIVKLRNGIRLTDADGVVLSQHLPKLEVEAMLASEENETTLFPYDKWKVEDYAAYIRKKQQLQQDIVKANDEKANLLRLELAKLNLADGRHLEALALINMVRQTNPQFYKDYQVAALRGAANFMLDRVAEAAGDFADDSLQDMEEIDYWKQNCALLLGQSRKELRFTRFDKYYSKIYPPLIRQKLALIAADQSIEHKRYNAVLRIFDALHADKQFEPIKERADFLVARILAETGRHKEAEKNLSTIIDESKDRFLVARAEYTLATMQYETGEIDRKELIDRLERLQLLWRGDALEYNTLKLLADLYILDERYADGLRAMKTVLRYFPTSADAPQMARRMATLFIELFNEGKADNLRPLDALALFYEFKDLTPIGPAGDKMIQNLADRLAGVDLLAQAAQLLEHQVKFRLEGEERSRVGARLALLYLFNREPRKALDVLELTNFGSNPEDLQRQRSHLAAKAYAGVGEWQRALDVIQNDFSKPAKDIKLDVYWENKDWDNVAVQAEDMLASRKDITAPLTDSETQTLLRLAIAYNFTGDTPQLKYLRDYFTPLLKNNPYQSQLAFLTNVREPLNPDNIGTLARDISQIENFLDTYRKDVQQNGLSAAIQ